MMMHTVSGKKWTPKINGYNSTKVLSDLSEILHMVSLKHMNKNLPITVKNTGQLQFYYTSLKSYHVR